MNNYIKLDENARILLEPMNYTLEYRVKVGEPVAGVKKTREFKWVIGGYYADLTSLSTSYVENAPARSNHVISSLSELVKVIQDVEKHIEKLIKGK